MWSHVLKYPLLRILVFLLPFTFTTILYSANLPYFKIHVVDEEDGRGIPMVSLTTTNDIESITDSNGYIAFYEPGLMDTTVHFMISSHGYSYPKDGFGYAGVRLDVKPNGSAVIKLKRENIAQRLYRITGQGIYRDSILLGEDVPTKQPVINALVTGQDSVVRTIYQNKIYWFWGDTNRPAYPLGNFKTTGAVSELPANGGLHPEKGINLQYFTNDEGFVKPMFSWDKPGVVWIFGLLTLNDPSGKEVMLTHYTRLKNLGTPLEHGIAQWDDGKQEFIPIQEFDLEKEWQAPRHYPIRITEENGEDYFYFADWFSIVRVRADYDALLDQSQYEAFTCIEHGNTFEGEDTKIELVNDKPHYSWKKNTDPITSKQEQDLVEANLINLEDTHFLPKDIENGKSIVIHRGSIRWNEYRDKWVMIGGQLGGTSMLGEIWYAEANHPTGPWRWAQKIVTHDHYTFYNPNHHDFFDQDGGRMIYFEGTYTKSFSGNDVATPRYDYNQIMYRLDLDRLALEALDQS